MIEEGDLLEYEVGAGVITNRTRGIEIPVAPLPAVMVEILLAGGVVNYYKINSLCNI